MAAARLPVPPLAGLAGPRLAGQGVAARLRRGVARCALLVARHVPLLHRHPRGGEARPRRPRAAGPPSPAPRLLSTTTSTAPAPPAQELFTHATFGARLTECLVASFCSCLRAHPASDEHPDDAGGGGGDAGRPAGLPGAAVAVLPDGGTAGGGVGGGLGAGSAALFVLPPHPTAATTADPAPRPALQQFPPAPGKQPSTVAATPPFDKGAPAMVTFAPPSAPPDDGAGKGGDDAASPEAITRGLSVLTDAALPATPPPPRVHTGVTAPLSIGPAAASPTDDSVVRVAAVDLSDPDARPSEQPF